jgi:hypothetical protein
MADYNGRLYDLINELPPEDRQEVEDFVEFLIQKKRSRKQDTLLMDWAGGLKEFKDKYSALGLQQKALEWWGD